MAEFALGLTKTAVESTVSLVKSAVDEEAQLKEKVHNDLVFISDELEMVQSFLRVANNNRERARNDQVVLTRVRQLRRLAFDVEDCIEFVLHLDLKSRWAWLRRAWQKVYCCAPPLPLDTAIAEIKRLKARVEDVGHRDTRYNLIHDSDNRTVTVLPPAAELEDATTYPSLAFHTLREVWEAAGKRRHDMGHLQGLIDREDDDLQVISIWGRSTGGGDLGTDSILTKAYCDPKICIKFETRAWVKLMHPFNHDEFVKRLLAQFYANASSHQANSGIEAADDNFMKAKLMQQMREQRYLVVLEDVFSVAEWNVIRMYLPDSKNGSRIVVSTPQLRIALLCTGEPYQVSELRHFSSDNFLCAFFKKTRSDMGEFNWKLRWRGVIFMCGAGYHEKSNLVDILYKGIINRSKEFDGVEFARHSWVDVPDPFNLKVFAQRLFLNFYSDDIRASEIKEVGMLGEAGLIQRCCKFLFEEDCFVVINGLQCDDWDVIKSKFLCKPIKGCILVVTNGETEDMHCVKDHGYQALHVKDLEADTTTTALIDKGSWYYGLGGIDKGRLFYDRRKDALEWTDKFKDVVSKGIKLGRNVCSVHTLNESAVLRAKACIRNKFYRNGERNKQFSWHSWVYVPHPFDLMDFFWRLLLDFYSDDPQAKEAIAIGLMEGTLDPIQECRHKFLCEEKCLVVIDGLRSIRDWDSIKNTIFLQSLTIIVITNEIEVAYHCGKDGCSSYSYYHQVDRNSYPEIQDIVKEYPTSQFLSQRMKKATEWVEKFEVVEGGIQEFQVVGRGIQALNLAEHIDSGGVVSVWGIAGVGKSFLVRGIYYNQMLGILEKWYPTGRRGSYRTHKSLQKFIFGWVDVPHPFNLTEFYRRLLLDFHSDDPRAKETAAVSMMEGQDDPILECSKFLCDERCLVVIDGLQSTQDWDLIKATFLSETIKSTIVVITRGEKVAMHCVENNGTKVINIRHLEADAALDVFVKKIIRGDKQLDLEKEKLLKTIVGKSGGLPKVTAAIGQACESDEGLLESLRDNFMGTLQTEPRFHSLRSLFSWIQSYFDACSDSIKPCIFYLSIFSAEENIRRRRLLWRWVAEGYCRDTSDGTYEENGENFISELVNLSIIQESPSNKVLCQINSFFHEYIISRPMEDNLVFALEGRCSLNSQRAGQHLTIRSTWDRDEVVYESIDFSRLRSLTVFGKWESFFISNKNVNMSLLRVLDLEDARDVTDGDIEQIGKVLRRLKFLSLRGCRRITCLPGSMGGLRQLQTLDIRRTSIVSLPLVITNLHKLRYIRAGTSCDVWDEGDVLPLPADGEDRASSSTQGTNSPPPAPTDSTAPVAPSLLAKMCRRGLDNSGVKVRPEIGKLSTLHTLGVVNVNASCGTKVLFKALNKLTQLRKLGVSGINKRNIKELCEAICGHAHLKSLAVELDKDDKLDGLDDIPHIPETVNSLKVYGHLQSVQKLLDLAAYLQLKKLKLDVTLEKPDELGQVYYFPFRQAPHHLCIRPIQDGNLAPSFMIARVTEIYCRSVLHVSCHREICGDVEVLKVHFSAGSSLHTSELGELSNLKEVWLMGYSDQQKQDIQRQINEMQVPEGVAKPVLKLVQPRSSS